RIGFPGQVLAPLVRSLSSQPVVDLGNSPGHARLQGHVPFRARSVRLSWCPLLETVWRRSRNDLEGRRGALGRRLGLSTSAGPYSRPARRRVLTSRSAPNRSIASVHRPPDANRISHLAHS